MYLLVRDEAFRVTEKAMLQLLPWMVLRFAHATEHLSTRRVVKVFERLACPFGPFSDSMELLLDFGQRRFGLRGGAAAGIPLGVDPFGR